MQYCNALLLKVTLFARTVILFRIWSSLQVHIQSNESAIFHKGREFSRSRLNNFRLALFELNMFLGALWLRTVLKVVMQQVL